ncbi:MAG: hypothetical protein ACYS47_21575, partial [Planctomycetota bacterium]
MTGTRIRPHPWTWGLALLFGAALVFSGLPSCGKKAPKKSDVPRSRFTRHGQEAEKTPPAGKKTPPGTGRTAEEGEDPEDIVPLEGTLVERYPDRWYLTKRYGAPTGYIHVQLSYIYEDEQRLVRDETETAHWYHRKIAHMDDTFTTKAIHTSLRTEDGELIESESEVEQGEVGNRRLSVSKMKKEEGGYRFTMEMLNRKTEKFHPCDKTIRLDSESFLIPYIESGTWKADEVLQFHQMGGEKGTIYTFEARRIDPAVLNIRGKKEECLGVEVKNVETGSFHKEYFRPDGLLVCLVSDTMTYTFSNRREIRQIREAIDNGEIDLPYREAGLEASDVGMNLHGAFNLMALIVDVTLPVRPGIPEPKFDGGNFQDVLSQKKVGNRIVTRLRLKAFDKDVNTPYPVKVEGMEKYLEATVLMQVNDPVVKAAAKSAVGDAKDARTAALRISEFVNSRIRSGTGSIGQYSALEILQKGFGD